MWRTVWTASSRVRTSLRSAIAVPKPRPCTTGRTAPEASVASPRRPSQPIASIRALSSKTHELPGRSACDHHSRISAGDADRRIPSEPWRSRNRSAADSASTSAARRTVAASGTDELIEGVGKRREIVQLARRLRLRVLAEPVDPHRRDAERGRRCDVVEEARRDVDVAVAIGVASPEEDLPVPGRRLVRADLAGDDGQLELDADLPDRRLDEVPVGVGEDREPPAAVAHLLQGALYLGEGRPVGQRARERVALLRGQAQPLGVGQPRERPVEDLAIALLRVRVLHLRLELVVAIEQPRRGLGTEETLELPADAAVPVDERAVTVERRPAVGGHGGSLVG